MIQKPQKKINVKKASDKNIKNRMMVAEDIAAVSKYNDNRKEMDKLSRICPHWNECKWKTEKMDIKEPVNYSVLFQKLKGTQIKSVQKYIEMIDDRIVPYKIPAMYSLEYEKESLILMEKRLNIISRNICRTDVESIALDFKQIGGDLSGAICKYRKCYAESD